MSVNFLEKCYPFLESELLSEIRKNSTEKVYPKGEFIIQQGQYVRHLPIVKKGVVKVFTFENELEFLLYFIKTGDSCIYSFAHIDNGAKANFSAVAKEDCTLLLLPIEKVRFWIKKFSSLNRIMIRSYKLHYEELLNSTKQLMCHKLEDRLLSYLKERAEIAKSKILQLSHAEIAKDLGSSREVISRLMKILSSKSELTQIGRKIKLS